MKPPSPSPAFRSAVGAVVLVVLVVLAYAPLWSAGFIWDDDAHLTPAPLRAGAGLVRIWTEPGATQQYYPLLHSVFWVEHRLWGDAPRGYHVANLLFHLVATFLFWRVLRALAVPGAGLAAALFALHPVHVETVAWISEQKNTTALSLALAATLAWLRFQATGRRAAWWTGFGLFAAALACKTAIAPWPAALLVLAWWRRGGISLRQDVVPLLPWLLLAIGAGLFTAAVERDLIGARGPEFALSGLQRLALAGRLPWEYLGQLAWPGELVFIYPRSTPVPGAPVSWAGAALAIVVTAGLAAGGRRTRGTLAVWLIFIGLLFPVLGFFDAYPFRYSFRADHFVYFASLPVLAGLAAWVATRRSRFDVAIAAAVVALPALAWRTFSHAGHFRSGTALYRHTVERNPSAWMAWNNLGRELLSDPARRDEAATCFERALALRPDYFEARTNLGLVQAQAGQPMAAIPHLRRAVELQPASFQAHTNLGIALVGLGQVPEALVAFRTAAYLAPQMPNARENFGKALLLAGHRAEAAAEFAAAGRLRQTAAFARDAN